MRALGPVSAERGFAPHRARDDTRAHYPKKLIQPLTNTPKLTDMKPTSASVTSYHTLGPGQVIGLFLARLLACLLRLRARGETVAPPHIAPMVSAAAGRPMPAAQSERATASQTKARLMEIQKKRSELMRKRQGVRNYNDTSD